MFIECKCFHSACIYPLKNLLLVGHPLGMGNSLSTKGDHFVFRQLWCLESRNVTVMLCSSSATVLNYNFHPMGPILSIREIHSDLSSFPPDRFQTSPNNWDPFSRLNIPQFVSFYVITALTSFVESFYSSITNWFFVFSFLLWSWLLKTPFSLNSLHLIAKTPSLENVLSPSPVQ